MGTAWTTAHDGHTTYWLSVDYDPAVGRARYARTTPGVDTGTVEVRVSPREGGGSKVEVTYRVTGLSEEGNAHVAETYSEAHYPLMMEEWRRLVMARTPPPAAPAS